MTLQAIDEGNALMWLAALRRAVEIDENQIIIRIVPGEYGTMHRPPMFCVSIKHPDRKYRVRTSGVTLMAAVVHAQTILSHEDVAIPDPSNFWRSDEQLDAVSGK
jgi:hypothetical protein